MNIVDVFRGKKLPNSAYVYLPLDSSTAQIRLLKVQQPDKSGPICCDLQTFQLAQAPSYTALSYEWRSARFPREVLVNGGRLTIRRNLYQFLQIYCSRFQTAEFF